MNSVLILTNTLKAGGAEKQSIYLFKALRKIFDTHLLVYYSNQKDQRMLDLFPDETKEDIIYLSGNHLKKLKFLYKLFKQNPETICISYLATTNTINAFIGNVAGVKIRIGGIRNSKFVWYKKIIQKHLHNHWLSCSVFNNHNGFDELTAQGFKKEKGYVIFNCIEVPDYKYKENIKKINILTVGRFVEQKDYHTAFLAVKKLVKENVDIMYTIVGQGHLENELRAYVSKIEMDKNVEFIINPPNVDDYYKRADIYLSTSLFEGLSNSIMEAMSFGLPVVATDVGDNKYLVKENETGYLLPIKDEAGISNKLLNLIKDPGLRIEMGKNGYNHIKENFSIDKFSNEYLKLINRLIDEKR